MKKFLAHLVTLLCAVLIRLTVARLPSALTKQQTFPNQVEAIPKSEQFSDTLGRNNVTFGPVPRENQLFNVDYIELAPSPMPL